MMNDVKRIAVVGGGTAGLVAALILQARFNSDIKIDLIRSKNIPIVGVGEGSTEHWLHFMQFINISATDVIKNCDSTYKLGIMFKGWTEKDYFHSAQYGYMNKYAQYYNVAGKMIGDGLPQQSLSSENIWNSKVPKLNYEDHSKLWGNQFHFNTYKLNDYLTKLAISRGVGLIEDDIVDVQLDEHGNICKLVGEQNQYEHDFYIDSTGFRRVLMSKLGAKWESYSKYLKMNAAVTFQTEDTVDYNAYTTAQAMDYGWMFNLPVWGRHGNGYIFDSNYIDGDQAKAEIERFLGHSVQIGKTFNFDPGCLEKGWIKNCVAIGLSSQFIEPMEASSIGSSIQQSFMLMHRLINYDENTIESYNKSFKALMHNIRDYVALHYMVKKDNTQFWRDVQEMPIPPFLEEKLPVWKNKLPIEEDFIGGSRYNLFNENNYILCLHGIGHFNTESIRKEYEAMNLGLKSSTENMISDLKFGELNTTYITHKQYIANIRNS